MPQDNHLPNASSAPVDDLIEQDVDESPTLSRDPAEGSDEGDLNLDVPIHYSHIQLEKADRSLAEFKRWYDDGDLTLDPEWQRNYVWTRPQASKLIESFLLNIPVPVVYLSVTQDGRYEVIDGLQRLKTAFDFLNNDFKLIGLDVRQDLNGRHYRDLDAQAKRTLRNSTLRSFELSSDTDPNIHFLVFERLNTGGTKLNEMEIRNCIFRGPLNELIKELACNTDFVRCVNQGGLSKRMQDRGYVLRFLAFYERTHLKCTHGLKRFLNEFLETYRAASDKKVGEYRKVFRHCMQMTLTVFGEYGFRLKKDPREGSRSREWNTRTNAAIFQCVATSFQEYSRSEVTASADRIYEEYLDMITSDDKWVDYVRRATGERNRLTYVFESWRRRLREVLADAPQLDNSRAFSKDLKNEMFRQCSKCEICDNDIKLIDDAVLDHEQYYWRGGRTIPENARLVHRYCNMSRGGGR